MAVERKKLLLRLDPAVHDALARWAGEDLRSTNAQIEFLLRRALAEAGRLPSGVSRIRRPGRPSRAAQDEEEPTTGPAETASPDDPPDQEEKP
ncbi:hypothetical protein EDD29_1947 [Actinocorallia herbida]|uniref:Toxin-antitoxin system HicB family antitoxin n=1 Tax=Actinocorallia herbida TaxID=58109 RepID=A0A3N1CTC5_9ACTN|nr:hypothetical protein [Actinocorallia herbida]ROO84424.1 hypothetical protein EDD29_1947 [Actinocorallia herbida]